jgi:hypothetical protein
MQYARNPLQLKHCLLNLTMRATFTKPLTTLSAIVIGSVSCVQKQSRGTYMSPAGRGLCIGVRPSNGDRGSRTLWDDGAFLPDKMACTPEESYRRETLRSHFMHFRLCILCVFCPKDKKCIIRKKDLRGCCSSKMSCSSSLGVRNALWYTKSAP